MSDDFQFDVSLSHSMKNKAVARTLAERLRQDGLKVWFDERVLKAASSIPVKIEEGLEQSRVLVPCIVGQCVRLGLGAVGDGHVPPSRPAEPGGSIYSPAARRH